MTLLPILTVKDFWKSASNWQIYGKSTATLFLTHAGQFLCHPYICKNNKTKQNKYHQQKINTLYRYRTRYIIASM